MLAGEDGHPDPTAVVPFLTGTGHREFPGVDIQVGPEGDLFYASLFGRSQEFGPGAIHRIAPGSEAPIVKEPEANGAPPVAGEQPSLPAAGAPRTRIRRHPPRRTRSRWATFAFSASGGDAFRCRLDRRRYRRCRSPRVYRHLRPGRHRFRVFAIAADGLRERTPARFAWRVKRTPSRRSWRPTR